MRGNLRVAKAAGKPRALVGGGAPDTTPNSFAFTDVTGATLGTVYTSNAISVSGVDAPSPISITGGTYSKNGAAYTSASGTVVAGDTVAVRVTSSANNATTVDAVLTIGGVTDTYSVATAASSLVPVGQQIMGVGDGISSTAAASNMRNMLDWAIILLGGKVYHSPAYMKADSGGDLNTVYARMPIAAGNQADIPVFLPQGHNTNALDTSGGANEASDPQAVLAYDPAVTPGAINNWFRNVDDWIARNPNAKLLPVCTTPPDISNMSGSGKTKADAANAAQKAGIASRVAGDSRILEVDCYSGYDPANMSPSTDAGKVHPDERGGRFLGKRLADAIAARMEVKTRREIADMMAAGTYPGFIPLRVVPFTGVATAGDTLTINGHVITWVASGATGAQIATGSNANNSSANLNTYINANSGTIPGNPTSSLFGAVVTIAGITSFAQTGAQPGNPQALAGILGAKVGTLSPTGEVATGITLTNNLANGSGVSVTGSKVASTGGVARQQVDVRGTPAASNTVTVGDTANFTLLGSTPGAMFLAPMMVDIDDGAGGAPAGLQAFGMSAAVAAASASYSAPLTHPVSAMLMAPPTVIAGAFPPAIGRALHVRFGVTSLATNRVLVEMPLLGRLSTPTKSPAKYLGGDGVLFTSTQVMRPSGTVTNAAGGTLRAEPGSAWAPYGLTYQAWRLYAGGGSGGNGSANIGAGSLIASGTFSAPTYAVPASALAQGTDIYLEVDAQSGTGPVHTARSSSKITVG